MKKLSQFFCIALLTLASFANATHPNQENDRAQSQNHYTIQTPGFTSAISYDGDALLKFSYFNLSGEPIKFQLLQTGTSLLFAKYKSISVTEGFDLAQLPAGVYTIRLVQGEQIIERNITKKTQAIIFE